MNYLNNEFPINAFYDSVRLPMEEVCKHLQAPPALIAGAFLTGLSMCSQAEVDVELPTGQISPCSLYLCTIADSGERKTATDKLVLAPLHTLDAEASAEHSADLAEYRAETSHWKAKYAALEEDIKTIVKEKGDVSSAMAELKQHVMRKPTEPMQRRMLFESVTERPLMEALQGEARHIGILSSEGSIALANWASNLSRLNSAWDGPRVMRLGRADDIIEAWNARVTVSLMIQEKMFQAFTEKRGVTARESGFLARFLVSMPRSTQGFRHQAMEQPVWQELPKFHDRMTTALRHTRARQKAGDTSRRVLKLSPEARGCWVSIQNQVEPRLRVGGDLYGVRDFVAKSAEGMGRMAGCLHAFEQIAGDQISLETLDRAVTIMDFYLFEYVRLFGDQCGKSQAQRDVDQLLSYLHSRYWLSGRPYAGRRDLLWSGPVRDKLRFDAALLVLCNTGYTHLTYQNAGRGKGKGKAIVGLNPGRFSTSHFN